MKYASRQHYADHLASIDIDGLDVVLVASYADLIKARADGHRRIVLMQHGIGQSYSDSNPAYPGGRDNADVGLFLAPGPHPAQRWRDAYPRASVEVVGSPRLDYLPLRSPGPLTVAVTFHWRDGGHEKSNAFAFYRTAIAKLAQSVKVIGHAHPRANRLERFYRMHDIEYVPSFDDVCRRADVLLFDNTSAGYEFASTGRPVVVLNSPEYRKTADHGLRFWQAADVGIQVDVPARMEEAVWRALASRPGDLEARETALSMVYGYRTGAARRSREVIERWA